MKVREYTPKRLRLWSCRLLVVDRSSRSETACDDLMPAEMRLTIEPGFPAQCSIRSDHASTDWPEHLAIAREAILDTLEAHGALVLRGALRKKQEGQTDAERLEQVLRPADALPMLCE